MWAVIFMSAFSMVVITVNSQTGLPLEEQSYCPPMSLLGALFFCCTNASLECILKFRLSRWNFKTKTKYASDICTLLCLQTQEPVPLCKNLALVTVLQISSLLSSLGWRISGSLLWCLILHCDVQSSCLKQSSRILPVQSLSRGEMEP